MRSGLRVISLGLASALVAVASTPALATVVPGLGEVYATYQLDEDGPVTRVDPTFTGEWDWHGDRSLRFRAALPLVAKGGGVLMDDDRYPTTFGIRSGSRYDPPDVSVMSIIRPACPDYACYGQWAVEHAHSVPGQQQLHIKLDESSGMEFAGVERRRDMSFMYSDWEINGPELTVDLSSGWMKKYPYDVLELHITPLPAPVAFLGTAMAALWTWRRFGHGAAGGRGRRETG